MTLLIESSALRQPIHSCAFGSETVQTSNQGSLSERRMQPYAWKSLTSTQSRWRSTALRVGSRDNSRSFKSAQILICMHPLDDTTSIDTESTLKQCIKRLNRAKTRVQIPMFKLEPLANLRAYIEYLTVTKHANSLKSRSADYESENRVEN